MSEQNATIEIDETSNESAPVKAKTVTMTEAEATTSGLSADEIVAGKKHGLILDDKPAKKTGETEGADEEEEEGDEGKSDDTEEVEDVNPKDAADEDLDPEEEQELVKNYNDNEKSLYWKAKKERLKRQNAQSENEHTKIKLAAAQREIDLLKKGEKKNEADDEEENNGEDDDARVMTVGEFKKLLTKQKEDQGKQNAEVQATIVRLESQEAEFKADHPDFDEVMDLAKEMMDKKPSFRQMLLTAGADPKENAAEIAYSIGQLNPKYKKGGSDTAKEAGTDTKTKVDKAIKNADKRQSSAAVSSGGTKRIVSEDDLTVEEAANLSPVQYGKLSRKTRDRLLKESCA